jgi:hypothetical protein
MAYTGPVRIEGGMLVRAEAPPAPAPSHKARHVHIHLPPPARGKRTHDAAPPRRLAVRRGDLEPEGGQLLCRVKQDGTSGDWSATDANGNPLMVRRGADGTLEIVHHPDNGDEDPDQIQLSATAGDANAGAPGELVAGQAFEARMSAALAPSPRTADRGPASLRGLQRLMDQHYRRR